MHRSMIPVALCGAALALTTIAGCSNGGSSTSAPSGAYESKFGPPGNAIKLNFLEGNNVEITVSEGGRDQTQKTSFVTSGESIIIDVPDSEGPDLTLTRNGAALEATMQGMTMRFDKL